MKLAIKFNLIDFAFAEEIFYVYANQAAYENFQDFQEKKIELKFILTKYIF